MLEELKAKETPLNYILAVSWRLIFKEQEILPFLRYLVFNVDAYTSHFM